MLQHVSQSGFLILQELTFSDDYFTGGHSGESWEVRGGAVVGVVTTDLLLLVVCVLSCVLGI